MGFARCLAGLIAIGGEARGGEVGTGGFCGLGGSSKAGGGLCAVTVPLSGGGNREVGVLGSGIVGTGLGLSCMWVGVGAGLCSCGGGAGVEIGVEMTCGFSDVCIRCRLFLLYDKPCEPALIRWEFGRLCSEMYSAGCHPCGVHTRTASCGLSGFNGLAFLS